MKLSSPTALRPKTPPSFLLRGAPGGGKTTLGLQFPRVWLGDIDLNVAGPEAHLRKGNAALTYAYDTISLDDNLVPIVIANGSPDYVKIWLRLKQKVLEAIKSPDVTTVMLDGLTGISQLGVRRVMQQNSIDIMERQHWIPFRNILMELVMECRHAGKPFIMTCHEEIVLAKDGTVEQFNIAMSSKLKDIWGGLFTDIYLCSATASIQGGRKFEVRTGSDARRRDIKTSFPDMPIVMDVTKDGFNVLNKYMKLC